MGVRKVSKTGGLCPFNGLIPCDSTCEAYLGRKSGCSFANAIDRASHAIHNISECADEATGALQSIGDGLESIAESLSSVNQTLFDTLGSPETGAALNAIANIGDVVPDMSDVADGIDNLARMINPNEYKVLVSEIAESAVKAAKEAQRLYEAHVRMCNADDA